MESYFYFYLEPYVYLHVGDKSVLMVNLLDDRTLVFSDKKSIQVALKLVSDSHRTVKIKEEDISLPLVVSARACFMGDVTCSVSQPFQFYPEINVIQEGKAYRKTISYTKTNIYSHIMQCTVFIDFSHQDCKEYIDYCIGEDSSSAIFHSLTDKRVSRKNLDKYLERLSSINIAMKIYLCGGGVELLNSFSIEKFPNLVFVYSVRTLTENPRIYKRLVSDKLPYILMLDLAEEVTAFDLNSPLELWGKISRKESICIYEQLVKQGKRIRPFIIKNSQNLDLIKETMTFTKEELLNIKNKFQVIKSNNLINTNFWGHIYVLPDGSVSYSLMEDKIQFTDMEHLQEDFKKKFFQGNFSWTQLRGYPQCLKCVFRYLCPSPSYLENILRNNGVLTCLLKTM